MQIKGDRLSQLRQRLKQLCNLHWDWIGSFLAGDPLIKGSLYTLRRKCFKASCRCARGQRHESLVLTANVEGRTKLWMIPPEGSQEIRQAAQTYRRFRQARKELIQELSRRRSQMLETIAAIENIRLRRP